MAANSRFVELNKKTKQVDASKHFKLLMHLLAFLTCCEVCCVFYLVLASAVLVRKLFFVIKTLIFIVIVYYCVTVKVHMINRTLHGSSKIWILCSRAKNNISLVRCSHSCSCHSNIQSISSRNRAIFYIYIRLHQLTLQLRFSMTLTIF